jgi:hypothetical protein
MKVLVTFPLLLCVMTVSGTAQVAKPLTLAGDAPEGPTHSAGARNYSEGVLIPRNTALQPDAVIGARMRIRTASTIELPGLIRLEEQTISGPVVSSDVDTVTTTSGADEQGVTVPRPNRRIVGVLTNVTPQILTMRRDDGSAVTVPRIAIAMLERQVGRRSRCRAAGWGFLIGSGGGAGVGYLIGRSCHSTQFLGCFLEPAASTFGGVVIGGASGAVIGALARPSERWLAVPSGWLDGQRVP